MVNSALYYATDHPVGYKRDSNDCTTFISWALYQGGWAEEGAQSYPSVTWNHDDFNVWYWRCSSCSPVHSYTWGAAYNWTLFAYSYGRRVTALSYMTDLAYAALRR